MSHLSPLPSLLLSADVSVRSRGVALLSSFLISHSSLVLDSFADFLPFFMSQLNHGQRDSMGFSAINYFLYRALVSSHSTINQKSLLPILQYLAAFLDTPPTSSPIPAVSYILFPSHKYLKCVKLLASRKFTEIQFPPMLRILAATRLYDEDDRLIGDLCSLLEPSAAQFASSVVKWPDATISEVIRSLLIAEDTDSIAKERLKVPQLASEILHSVIVRQKSAEVTRLCFPYLAKIRTHPLYGTNRNLQEVQATVWKAIQQEKFTPQVNAAPFAIFAGIEYEAATFSGVPSSFTTGDFSATLAGESQIAPEMWSSDPRAGGGAAAKERSLMAFLDSPLKISLQPQQPPRPPRPPKPKVVVQKPPEKPRVMPIVFGAPRPQKLKAVLTKKKSGKFGSQSKYAYEFSPVNRSLVWRSESKKESVKGAIILQPGVDIQGTPNSVIIKSGGKTHEILFGDTKTAEDWAEKMKRALAMATGGK